MRANWILRLSAVVVVAVIFVAISGALAGTPTSLDPQPMFVIDPDPMIVVGPGGAGGNYELRENTSGQWIEIIVSGGAPVAGCNFNAQIGDGGPPGPIITGVDLEGSAANPTIFFGNSEPQNDLGSVPQLAMYSIITDSGTIFAEGVLARLEIDTTGFFGDRTWPLALGATLNGPTDFAGLSADITDGGIHIPEPASLALLLLGGSAVFARRTRRREGRRGRFLA